MAYVLPIRRRNGLQILGIAVNVSNRIEITEDDGVTTREIVNTPDLSPASGGKFPAYLQDPAAAVVPIAYTNTGNLDGILVAEFLDGMTPGDANTAERQVVRDGEAWLVRARLTNVDGQPYAYTAFSTLAVKVYDQSTGSATIYTATAPALAVVVQSELMDWTHDEYGYTVLLTILPADLNPSMEGGHVYKAELVFTLNTGGAKIVESWAVVRSEQGA